MSSLTGDLSPLPTVTWAEVEWRPTIPRDLLTRAQRERYRGPYRAAVVPPIADKVPVVAPDIVAAALEASAMVSRFDADLGDEVAPFSSILLRSESASSSQIENLSSGAKQIALAELGSRDKRNATAVVGTVAAMRAAIGLADRLDGDAILAMHHALMEDQDPDIAGRWRSDAVWIGGTSIGPHDADFVAPQAESVPGLVGDLVAFARRTDVAPLILIAVAHAQFEAIHPFPDGNGRTGRALIQSMMRHYGLTTNVTVPVSAGLLQNTQRYFDALDAYRHGDVTPIVSAVAGAAQVAVGNGRLLVADLRGVADSWAARLPSRQGSASRRLLDVLLRRPVIDSDTVAAELGINIGNVGRTVQPLVEAGILREFTGFNRNRMWHVKEVTDALDAFADRAARRLS